MSSRASTRDLALYGLMTTIWGSSYFFTSIALDTFDPPTLLAVRMSLGAGALGTVVAVRRPSSPRGRRVAGHLALLGALNIALPFQLITWGQTRVATSVAAVLSATTPIFVLLIVAVLTRGAALTATRVAGVLVAFSGVVALSVGGDGVAGGGWFWPGLILASSVVFAGGNVYTGRFLRGVDPVVVAAGQIIAGAAYLVPIALVRGVEVADDPSVASIAAVAELGLLGSGVAYLLFFRFIIRWSSTAASFNTYLQPLVGVALGMAFLDERLTGRQWLALVAILAGLALFTSDLWRQGIDDSGRLARGDDAPLDAPGGEVVGIVGTGSARDRARS